MLVSVEVRSLEEHGGRESGLGGGGGGREDADLVGSEVA